MEERNAKIVETAMDMWRAGRPWADISQKIGKTRQRINQILAEAGISLKMERQRMIQDEVARIIAEAQERGEYITAACASTRLRERGVHTTPGRALQEMRKTGLQRGAHGGHPPMIGPKPDTLHCPSCGWQPLSAFAPQIQRIRKNGFRCRKCQSAYYYERRYGARKDDVP